MGRNQGKPAILLMCSLIPYQNYTVETYHSITTCRWDPVPLFFSHLLCLQQLVQSSPVPALYHDIQPSATQHHLGHWCPGTMFLQQPPRLELMLLFFGENKFPCVQHLPSLLKHRLRHLHPMTRVSGFESWLSYKL